MKLLVLIFTTLLASNVYAGGEIGGSGIIQLHLASARSNYKATSSVKFIEFTEDGIRFKYKSAGIETVMEVIDSPSEENSIELIDALVESYYSDSEWIDL